MTAVGGSPTMRGKGRNLLLEASHVAVRRANPALFAIIMGTGGISNLFIAFPYGHNSTGMLVASLVFFFINLVLFIIFSALVAAKYICYPDRWSHLFQNPVISLYAGTFPMGATTLINVAVSVIHEEYRFGGRPFLYFLWATWWADVVVAGLCAWVGVHVMFTNQKHSLQSLTAMWLLPVVTLIVAASTGGLLSNSLQKYSTSHAVETAAASTFLVTVGFTLAFMVLTGYLMRLVIHGLPVGGSILSVFLPLGPTGQSGYAILLIGQSFSNIFPAISNTPNYITSAQGGTIIRILCIASAFSLWSLATMWLVYAVLALHSSLRNSLISFRLSFWGLVFPNSVYANLTILLAQTVNSNFLRIWGAIYAIICLLLWTAISVRSLVELKTFFSRPQDADAITTPPSEEFE